MSALSIIPALIFLLLAVGLIVKLIESLLQRPGYDASPQKVRMELQRILEQDGWRAFDNFVSVGPLKDPRLEAIRQRCADLPKEFPPKSDDDFLAQEGIDVIRGFIRELGHETAA